jgi:chromosome segregation ATPase
VCLKRNDDLKVRAKELDDLATVINSQRPEIEQALDAVRAERAALETRAARAREFQPKMAAYSQRVQAFSAQMDELNGRSRLTTIEGRELEERRKQIPVLEAERKALNEERDRLMDGYEDSIKAFAAKAKAAEDRAAEWNRRRSQHTQDLEDLTAALSDWRRDCADRPYLEDDEKAIRAGR